MKLTFLNLVFQLLTEIFCSLCLKTKLNSGTIAIIISIFVLLHIWVEKYNDCTLI